jgi:hypothetical protein
LAWHSETKKIYNKKAAVLVLLYHPFTAGGRWLRNANRLACAQVPTPSASLIAFGGSTTYPEIQPGTPELMGGVKNAWAALPTRLFSFSPRDAVMGSSCSLSAIVSARQMIPVAINKKQKKTETKPTETKREVCQ